MSPEEKLAAAVRALRDTPEAPDEMVAATERQVLAAVAAQPSSPPGRRRSLVTAAVALALVGTTGLAAARAGLIEVPRWLGEVIGVPDARTRRAVPRPVPSAVAPPPQSKPEPAAALDDALEAALARPLAPAVGPPDPPVRTGRKRQADPVEAPSVEPAPKPPSVAVTAPPSEASSSRPTPAPTSPDELYAEGHRAHFVEENPKAALEAWDAYLAVAPNGRFAPEARFNRAIDLVRLGRTGEAADALEGLAHGDYRPADAARLLEAIHRGAVRGE
jgi:hypothetical protein